MRRTVLAASWAALLLLGGCNEETAAPEPPRCVVEPSSMTFPVTLRPHRANEQIIHGRNLTLTNDPLVISSGGSRPLEGAVTFEVDGLADPSSLIRFKQGNGGYLLQANESETFAIEVTVGASTAPGIYRGRIVIGPDCSDIPFTIEVQGRVEAPPAHLATWGGPGGGDGEFAEPIRIQVDAAGMIYVVESGNERVQILNSEGQFAGSFEAGVRTPTAVVVDDEADSVVVRPPENFVLTDQIVYLAERSPLQVTMYDRQRRSIKDFGILKSGERLFQTPVALALDARRNLLVLDAATSEVITLDPLFVLTAERLSAWGSKGPADGQVLNAVDMALDTAYNVFISDNGRDRVSVFDPDGNLLRLVGETGNAAGQLDGPVGIAIDPSGNLYVADSVNRRVVKFGPDGGFLTAWNGASSGPELFSVPIDVAIAPDGRILVLDLGRSRILVFAAG